MSMRWYNVNQKLPKKTDYYLISDLIHYSIGIFDTENKTFIDCNTNKPILHENVKYWTKVPMVPICKTNVSNAFFN